LKLKFSTFSTFIDKSFDFCRFYVSIYLHELKAKNKTKKAYKYQVKYQI